jgi:uncharacterized membrane protein
MQRCNCVIAVLSLTVEFFAASANKLKTLLSFAVGGLLGDVFLHSLPEIWANDAAKNGNCFLAVVIKLVHYQNHFHLLQSWLCYQRSVRTDTTKMEFVVSFSHLFALFNKSAQLSHRNVICD